MTSRLIEQFGHKPSCNDAGNPPDCTCEIEAQAHMKMCADAIARRIDAEAFRTLWAQCSARILNP